jgi:hypothetical protein
MPDTKTVSFRVFLDDSERTQFKVACAEEKTTMSQKSRELISQWLQIKKQIKEETA